MSTELCTPRAQMGHGLEMSTHTFKSESWCTWMAHTMANTPAHASSSSASSLTPSSAFCAASAGAAPSLAENWRSLKWFAVPSGSHASIMTWSDSAVASPDSVLVDTTAPRGSCAVTSASGGGAASAVSGRIGAGVRPSTTIVSP